MAETAKELREAMLAAGLWVKPMMEWIEAEGLETVDDLRCYFSSQEAADEVGPMVGLAWSTCKDVRATDAWHQRGFPAGLVRREDWFGGGQTPPDETAR